MGYRIEYQSAQKKYANKSHYMRLPVLVVLCFFLFLFLVETLWPDGAALIRKAAFYPKEVIAVSALNDLADELRYGESLVTAFADFCRKLVS